MGCAGSGWPAALVKVAGFLLVVATWRARPPTDGVARVLLPVAGLLLLSAVSMFWTLAPLRTWWRILHLAQEFVFTMIVLLLAPRIAVGEALGRGALLGASVLAASLLPEFFWGDVVAHRVMVGDQPPGLGARALTLAALLALPGAAGPLALGAFGLIGVGAGMFGNRTAWIALGVPGLWMAYRLPRIRRALVALLLGLAVGVAAWQGRADLRPATFGWAREEVVEVLSGRPGVWAAAWGIYQRQPWTGVGAGAFPLAYEGRRLKALVPGGRRGVPLLPTENLILGFAAELGSAGLLAGAWLLWSLFRAARGSPEREALFGWLILCGLTGNSLAERSFWVACAAILAGPRAEGSPSVGGSGSAGLPDPDEGPNEPLQLSERPLGVRV